MARTNREFAELIIGIIRSHYPRKISYNKMAQMLGMPYATFYARTPDAQRFTPWSREDIVRAAEVFKFSEEEKLELLK